MTPLENIYKGAFFKRRDSLAWRVPIICNAVVDTFELSPGNKIMDVGCAIGDYVDGFYERGFKARGIEGSPRAMEYFVKRVADKILIHDLRTPLPSSISRFNLCMCLEVAEHIEEEYSDVFLDNLCQISRKILLTASPPGQEGHHHVNCQPDEYWEEKMLQRGYQRWLSKELLWRTIMRRWAGKKGIWHYRRNAMIYRRVK